MQTIEQARSAARDTFRSRVYAAESQVAKILRRGGTIEHYGSTLVLPEVRKFGDVASIPAYLDQVLAYSPVARLDAARVPVSVRERKGAKKAHYEHWTRTIAIPPYAIGGAWALDETVVLHELAHHVTSQWVLASIGSDAPASAAHHDAVFTAHLIYLFEHVIGPEAAHLLRVAFAERNVPVGATP